jgi:hypothetical protein
MHALVFTVTINDFPAAKAELDEIVPRVSGSPGFVAGYWVALSQDKGISTVVYESEAEAQAGAARAAAATPVAVTFDSVEVGEVIAHA